MDGVADKFVAKVEVELLLRECKELMEGLR